MGKGKIKFFTVHGFRAYRGSRDIAPLLLNLGFIWRWVVNITALQVTLACLEKGE
jgi:hypothetical protein